MAETASGSFLEEVDEEQLEGERLTFEPERALVVERDDQIVATSGIYTRELSVPGAVLPAAHVSWVSVALAHRRNGLLRRMIMREFADVRALGREPIAVLWASEGRIYQRFGYGLATMNASLTADTGEVRVHPRFLATPGQLRSAIPSKVVDQLSAVFERVRRQQPGFSGRDERWWQSVLVDPKAHRNGASAKRVLLHEGPDGVDGYVIYRTKPGWSGNGPTGETMVRELVAATPAAHARLWAAMLTVDLTRKTTMQLCSPTAPLLHLVDEPRQLGAKVGDGLWLRILDVPGALAGRHYSAPVDLVLAVTDEVLPELSGRYRLRADASGMATSERTDDPADLACDVATLAAAYLGGTALSTLAAAGRLQELTDGALRSAGTAFSWHVAPYSTEVF